ncbi:MAG TPA: hypothetical protein VK996_02245 [Ramlibacter sp.]|nr:hypothetical protein [Ramlibacter sp.]
MKKKTNEDDPALPATGGGDESSSRVMDSEEARIYRQSIPAEEITKDFLQELLEEHHANQKKPPPP